MSRAPRFPRPGGRAGAALLSLLTVAFVLAPGLRPTSADQLSDKQNQRSQLNGLMNHLQQQIQAAKDQEAQLQQVIDSVDQQIGQTEQSINDAQAKLDGIGANLAAAQSQLAQTRAKLAVDKGQLSHEMVYIYEQGRTSTLNQVLGSSTFNEFWQKLIDLRRLAGSQQTTLRSVQQEEAQVTSLVAQIAAQQAAQKQLLAQLRTQAAELQIELGARQAAQARLVQVQQQDQQQLALAEQSAREVDAQIAAIKEAMAEAAR